MTNTPKPIVLSADDAASQALGPAIEWAKGYGRMTAIANTLTLATGSSVSRQMVGRWLNPDPTKRMQTTLGTGLMLLHVVALLSAESASDVVEATHGYVAVLLKPKTRNRNRKNTTKK